MRVTLIYLPVEQIDDNSSLKAQERNLGVFPPLSLGYVAAVMEEAGHEVDLIDSNALRLPVDRVVDRVRKYGPRLIGFTITTHMFHNTLNWIRRYKAALRKPVMVGGVHVGLYANETLAHPEIDYALIGEAEANLPRFLEALEKGEDLKQVPGLCFRRDGSVVVTGLNDDGRDIDAIPFPARHHLPNDRYYSFITRRRNFTAMMTSRGCPFRCVFCAQRGRLRLRSAGNVLDEITECCERYGVREIDIFDTTFTASKRRVHEICQGVLARSLDLEWTLRTRCDMVDRDMLQAMARAGCRLIMYGIESADEGILRNLNKEISIDQVRDVIRWTREAGIGTLGFFMIGSPGETSETVERTIRLARELRLDHIQVTKITPFPGTELYERYVRETGDDNWRRYVLDPAGKRVFNLIGTELTSSEIQRTIRRMYVEFYFRPIHILRSLVRARSIRLVKRYAKAALDMLRSREDLKVEEKSEKDVSGSCPDSHRPVGGPPCE